MLIHTPARPGGSVLRAMRPSREWCKPVTFARAGYDLHELGRQLQARQVAAGRVGVTLPPKPPASDSHAA